MEIITTHDHTDFDALAAMLGAKKMYPEAVPLLPRRPNRNLRHFLTLYWDELPFVRPEDLPRRKVSRLILVDTQSVPSLRGKQATTEIFIIDHHPLSRPLEKRMTYCGGDTGATTTILVEQIMQAQIEISPVEATLLLLGIYEDTGSLSYVDTTPKDLRCAAWLLEQGANLEVVNEFLYEPLSEQQRELYARLVQNAEFHQFVGQTVVIATAAVEEYVEEVSTLAHRLRDLYDPAALFLAVQMDNRVQVVARSSSETIDVSEIAQRLGGGGHSRAAAAVIRDTDLAWVRRRLLELLKEHAKPAVTVAQIMSWGVHTLSPETTVAEAERMMRRYSHEGFPVVDGDHLVGVLTRREIDKALHHKLGGAPIETYMHKGEISVTPSDSVEYLQKVMIDHALGQVPVVEGGKIVGIVTRTDLIKLWSQPAQPSGTEVVADRIEEALPPPLVDLVKEASRTATEMGFALYFVGGLVRDLLLGLPNLDIDLVVEGEAIALAQRLAEVKGGRVHGHARFGTAKWILEGTAYADVVPYIDFVTARTEFYDHPTALPQIERSSIKQDLHRRDFTINAMAISLEEKNYGQLLDFYGGIRDLEQGLIRVLHSLSFVEDPTRMLRAVRLEQRLGFRIEERTLELIENALDLLDRVSADRVRSELDLIFQEEEPERSLRRLDELGVLVQVHPGLRYDAWLETKVRQLRTGFEAWRQMATKTALDSSILNSLYLGLLTFRLAEGEIEALIDRLRLPRYDAEALRQVSSLKGIETELNEKELRPSQVYHLLEYYSEPALFILWVASDKKRVRQRLEQYHSTLRFVEPEIDGEHLKKMGIKPGPIYGHILEGLRDARLDGEIGSLAEEESLVKKWAAQ